MALVLKNPPAVAGDIRDSRLDPWVRRIPWKREDPLEEGIATNSSIPA